MLRVEHDPGHSPGQSSGHSVDKVSLTGPFECVIVLVFSDLQYRVRSLTDGSTVDYINGQPALLLAFGGGFFFDICWCHIYTHLATLSSLDPARKNQLSVGNVGWGWSADGGGNMRYAGVGCDDRRTLSLPRAFFICHKTIILLPFGDSHCSCCYRTPYCC